MLSWTSWLSQWPFKPQTRVQSPPRVPISCSWGNHVDRLTYPEQLRRAMKAQVAHQIQKDCSKYMPLQLSWSEHLAVNQRVSGSSPERGANMAYQFRRVERQPVTLEVTGSSPVCVATSLLSYLNTSYTYSYIKHLLSNTPSPFLIFMCSWYILRGRAAVAQRPHKPCVTGSNPVPATIICSCGRVGRLRQIANLLRALSPPKVRILPATPRPKVLLSTELVDCTQRGTFFLPKFR